MHNNNNGYGQTRTQPSTELSFIPPEQQTYDRDDQTNGALADHDANAHYAVHIEDYSTQQPARGYNRSSSFADHPPHSLPHPAAEAAAAKVIAQGPQQPAYVVTEVEDHPAEDTNGYHANGYQSNGYHAEPVYGAPPQPALVRQRTFGKVDGPHHISATEAFPSKKGVADRSAGLDGGLPEPLGPSTFVGKRKVPWAGKFWVNVNWVMACIFTAWIAVTIAYYVVRATQSLNHLDAGTFVYAVWVLVIEVLGTSTLLIYAISLLVSARKWDPPAIRKPFSVRVVVPCYKEDIETLEETVECAIQAAKVALEKDMANAVHIYLCDDGPPTHMEEFKGKKMLAVALRQEMIDKLYDVHAIPVIRVTRKKEGGSANPKSDNLNNCLQQIYGKGATPPEHEVIAVFDADQAAHSHFFTSTLPWMDAGDDVGLVQSPQVFRGVHWSDDVFNHENIGFWHYLQPSYNVLGFISCAGTNFLVRASAFAQAGYFPTHTLTEDYAAGMEMCRHGWREVFVEDELVRGSAPDKVRDAFAQRSRWCKGPYQMLFSWKSPLVCRGLNLFCRILYASPCYIYVVSALASPTFMAIPVVYIWSGIFPGNLPGSVLIVLLLYAILSSLVKFYVRPGRNFLHDVRSHWNAEISTKNFWWMYAKASVKGTMAACGCAKLGWSAGSGGPKATGLKLKLKQIRQDLFFILLFAIILTVTVVYGFLMVAAGARFRGPLGISLMWCIYHALSPWLLLWYSILPFEHEIDKDHSRCKYLFGRNAFDILCHVAFVATFACFIIAFVLAYLTTRDAKAAGIPIHDAYSGHSTASTVFHYTVKRTFECLRHNCPTLPSPGAVSSPAT